MSNDWVFAGTVIGVAIAVLAVWFSLMNHHDRGVCARLYADAQTHSDTVVIDAARIGMYSNICRTYR